MENVKMIQVPEQELQDLLKQNKDFKADKEVLHDCIVKIMDLLGIVDPATGKVKEEIVSGEESFIPSLLKSVGDLMSLMTQSTIPLIGKKAKVKLEEKFDFIKTLIPIIQKHGQ